MTRTPQAATLRSWWPMATVRWCLASATVNGDDIVVTHTLTLQPGETQSLLQFGQQTDTSVFAAGDLSFFTGNGAFSATPALLQGLTETERASSSTMRTSPPRLRPRWSIPMATAGVSTAVGNCPRGTTTRCRPSRSQNSSRTGTKPSASPPMPKPGRSRSSPVGSKASPARPSPTPTRRWKVRGSSGWS